MKAAQIRHTPWGPAQHQVEWAPGIVKVTTPSHGGGFLSIDRYLCIPAEIRDTAYAPPQWYEEDCDWAIPFLYFYHEIMAFQTGSEGNLAIHDLDRTRQNAVSNVARYHPQKLAILRDRLGN